MGWVVTIDGPAGAGKSTTARELARRLGWSFLDTGAMYRVVTLAALEQGLELHDPEALGQLTQGLQARFEGSHAWLGDRDVSRLIREPHISRESRHAANAPQVREILVSWQRQAAQLQDVVTEGRDQGTIVFPDALAKFFLEASDEERARRRHLELTAKGEDVRLEQILADQQARDARDRARAIAPMMPADDAVHIESTGRTPEDVLAQVLEYVRNRISEKGTPRVI